MVEAEQRITAAMDLGNMSPNKHIAARGKNLHE
jgi:hypothetical protein